MFGHQDDKKDDKSSDNNVVAPDQPAENAAVDQTNHDGQADHNGEVSGTDAPDSTATTAPESAEPATDNSPDDDNAWGHPGTPLDDDAKDDDKDEAGDNDDNNPGPISDIIAPAGGSAPPTYRPASHNNFQDNNDDNTPHELIDIKQKALTDLAPLMGQLEQGPEDRFRTLMMMIQASDDQSLLKEAFASAEAIEDDKVRAQALLDVVNEINYFTQHPEN